jgi:hypothetical protein
MRTVFIQSLTVSPYRTLKRRWSVLSETPAIAASIAGLYPELRARRDHSRSPPACRKPELEILELKVLGIICMQIFSVDTAFIASGDDM